MEDYNSYINTLSVEEKTLLETIINKLAVSGTRQYNTQAATILFKNWLFLSNDDDLLKEITITTTNTFTTSETIKQNPIQEIKDDLKFLDDYVMEMQDMLRSKPIVTNLEKIRQYIDIINTKVSELE